MNPELLKGKKLLTKQEFLNSEYFKGYNIVTADVLNKCYDKYVLKCHGYK